MSELQRISDERRDAIAHLRAVLKSNHSDPTYLRVRSAARVFLDRVDLAEAERGP